MSKNNKALAKTSSGLALALVLAGCAVGPDFVRPGLDRNAGYGEAAPMPATAQAQADSVTPPRFQYGADIPAQWWTVFRSPRLNALVEQALRANPNIKAAEAALVVAQESVRAQRGAYLPQVSANFNPTRQKSAGILSPALDSGANPYNLHTAQLNISYMADVFGLNRRTVESLEAQSEFQHYQLRAAHLSLSSNVVASVVQIAGLSGQIEATEASIGIVSEQLGIQRKQLEAGAIPEANVIAQEALLAQTQAQLPALRKQLQQQKHLLAALTGGFPGKADDFNFTLAELNMPAELPVSLPSALVEHRPDIRAAEAQLKAASAQIGVAVANMLPQITLSADLGSSALTVGQLFSSGTGFWALAAGVMQPVFQGGTLIHRKRAAEAAFNQSAAQYQATVISAFQNVADSLRALEFDVDGLNAARTAEAATFKSLNIARRQLELGDVSYLGLLTAQQSYQQARLAAVQAETLRLADVAALFQALGGSWNKPQQSAKATP